MKVSPKEARSTPAAAEASVGARRRGWKVFLDCAASAPPDPLVVKKMVQVQERFAANPSSVHRAGLRAMREVELARMRIGERLGCEPDALVFTSGGTEANNLALKGSIWSAGPGPHHLVVSAIEHPCVLEAAEWLRDTGQASLDILPVDTRGRVSVSQLAGLLRPETRLVSVMQVNNEVGTVQPIAALGALCREAGVLFHTDACQGFCKLPLDLSRLPIDLVSINAHKVHGPKGVGALYVRPGVELAPLQHGGGHEGGLRSGTLNVAGIAGFGEAVARYPEDAAAQMHTLAQASLARLRRALPTLRVNGDGPDGVGNILNLSVPGLSGKALFMALDRRGIQVSASSACHSTKLTPSHVLLAMLDDPVTADEALRVSLGRFTTEAELIALEEALVAVVQDGALEVQ